MKGTQVKLRLDDMTSLTVRYVETEHDDSDRQHLRVIGSLYIAKQVFFKDDSHQIPQSLIVDIRPGLDQ